MIKYKEKKREKKTSSANLMLIDGWLPDSFKFCLLRS